MNERYANLDLLRAFAAIAVVVYHVIELTHWRSFPFEGPLLTFRIGWIGVDLFFVISGFVITRSALALCRADRATFERQYWSRRIARIVPLYAVTGALWIALFMPDFFSKPPLSVAWQLASHLTFTHSFWPATFDSILSVNWTLAIEMQFYLLVALALRWIERTPGWRIWVCAILLAWAWRATMFYFFGQQDARHVFIRVIQLPGTLDEFGAGIFLAKLLDGRAEIKPLRGWIWAAGAVVAGYICMGLFWSYEYWHTPGMVVFWRTLLGTFFMCVVATALHAPSLAGIRIVRPLYDLGIVSYGIYLWHSFAIQYCLEAELSSARALVTTLVLTVALSAGSWHLFEKRILEYGRKLGGGRTHKARAASVGSS